MIPGFVESGPTSSFARWRGVMPPVRVPGPPGRLRATAKWSETSADTLRTGGICAGFIDPMATTRTCANVVGPLVLYALVPSRRARVRGGSRRHA